MAVNKVEFGDQVVMDITDSTVSPEKLLSGETAYDRSGAKITGSLVTKDISIETKRSTGENVATISLDNMDYDIYALSEEEVADFLSGDQEVEGNPVALKTLLGGNAKSCSVDLEPIQNLHGYDHPWPGGAGINKMPSLVAGTYKVSGLKAVVNENGLVTVTGIKNISGSVSIDIPFEKSFDMSLGTYIHVRNSIPNSNIALDWGSGWYFSMAPADRIIEPNAIEGVTRLRLYHSSNVTEELNYTLQPSIEYTNTVTDWTPYENICPISGRDSVEVARTGKNLFNKDATYTTPNDVTVSGNEIAVTVKGSGGTVYYNENQMRIGGNTVTISSQVNGTLPRLFIRLRKLDDSGWMTSDDASISGLNYNSFYGGWWGNITFPITKAIPNCLYANIGLGCDSGTDVGVGNKFKFTNYQVELGSTASAYEPYQGETVTVQLGQTVYSGTLDVTNGKLTVTRKYVKVKLSEAASTTQGTACDRYNFNNVFTSNEVLNSGEGNNSNSISSHIAEYKYNTQDNVHFYFSASGIVLFVLIGTPTTTEIEFCGTLTTPIEITLTAEQISLLKGNNVVSTDGDNINLKYSADIKAWVENQLSV